MRVCEYVFQFCLVRKFQLNWKQSATNLSLCSTFNKVLHVSSCLLILCFDERAYKAHSLKYGVKINSKNETFVTRKRWKQLLHCSAKLKLCLRFLWIKFSLFFPLALKLHIDETWNYAWILNHSNRLCAHSVRILSHSLEWKKKLFDCWWMAECGKLFSLRNS